MADHSTGAAHAHEHEHHENHDVFGFWLSIAELPEISRTAASGIPVHRAKASSISA